MSPHDRSRHDQTQLGTPVSAWAGHSDGCASRRTAGFARICAFGLIGLLTACASYSARQMPSVLAETMPYRQAVGPLLLGVDPCHQPARQEELFDEDLAEAAILPIQVALSNRSEHPVRIETENFKLALPGNVVIGPASGSEIAVLLSPKPGAADYAAAGVGMLGGLAGTIGAIAGRLVSFVASGLLGWSRSDELRARGEDYSRKELKPITLGHRQSSRGFLYFVLPSGTPDFNEATLTLEVFENQTETLTFHVLMRGLGYKGRPSTKPDTPDPDRESKAR